jgi:hypothetical protein
VEAEAEVATVDGSVVGGAGEEGRLLEIGAKEVFFIKALEVVQAERIQTAEAEVQAAAGERRQSDVDSSRGVGSVTRPSPQAAASARAMSEAASTLPTVQRQKYEPQEAQEWWDEESMLVRVMEEENKEAEEALEAEPIGVDELLVQVT